MSAASTCWPAGAVLCRDETMPSDWPDPRGTREGIADRFRSMPHRLVFFPMSSFRLSSTIYEFPTGSAEANPWMFVPSTTMAKLDRQ